MSTIRLAVHSNTFKCDLEFKHRINIIKGDSGIGKTSLVDIFRVEGVIKDRESTYPVVIADVSNFRNILVSAKNQIIIFDDVSLVETDEFKDLVSEYLIKHNLYLVIIVRAMMPKMSKLSYSIHAIYEMYYDETLVNHYIREYYEQYTEPIDQILEQEPPVCLITEDTKAGFQFFDHLVDKQLPVFHSTNGKSSMVPDSMNKSDEFNVIAILDTAAYGCHIEEFISLTEDLVNKVTLLYDYECFEEVLVRSNFLNKHVTVKQELDDLPKYANNFKSWENYFQSLLHNVTALTHWKQTHSRSKLNKCYIENCNNCNILKYSECSQATFGDKFEILLKGTKFEYLLKFRNYKKKNRTDTTGTTSFFK